MSFLHRKHLNYLTSIGFLFTAASLQACPVCFAAPDSPESRGMTMAILFLLGTIGIVLCGVGSFVLYLVARQKEPVQAHVEFSLESQVIHPLQSAHQ